MMKIFRDFIEGRNKIKNLKEEIKKWEIRYKNLKSDSYYGGDYIWSLQEQVSKLEKQVEDFETAEIEYKERIVNLTASVKILKEKKKK